MQWDPLQQASDWRVNRATLTLGNTTTWTAKVGDVQNETQVAEEAPHHEGRTMLQTVARIQTHLAITEQSQTLATLCLNAGQRGHGSHVDVFQNFIPPDGCHKVTTPLTRSPCPTSTSYSTKMKMKNLTMKNLKSLCGFLVTCVSTSLTQL